MALKNPDGIIIFTTDWLESIGFGFDETQYNDEEAEEYYWINGGFKAIFDLRFYPHRQQPVQWHIANANGELLIDDPCTRDGVRELCEVLNIPLKTIGITS